MSNTHFHGDDQTTLCGQNGGHCYSTTGDRSSITCKRCIASLAKRDRAFQRKARKGIALPPYHFPPGVWPSRALPPLAVHHSIRLREDAARAIAREEGANP